MRQLLIGMIMLFLSFLSLAADGQSQKVVSPSIGGNSDGSAIAKAALVKAGKIDLSSSTYKVSFFIMSYMNKQQRVELVSNSENLTPEMKTAINGLTSGARIEFTKIACKPANDNNAAPKRVGQFTITIQ